MAMRSFGDVAELERNVNDLFRYVFNRPRRKPALETMSWSPDVDVIDRKNEVLVRVSLPGVKKEDIHISISDGELVMEGESKAEEGVKDEDYYCCENSYGNFHRSISIPASIEKDRIKATYRDGMLKVHLPKDESLKGEEIEIGVG